MIYPLYQVSYRYILKIHPFPQISIFITKSTCDRHLKIEVFFPSEVLTTRKFFSVGNKERMGSESHYLNQPSNALIIPNLNLLNI